MKRVAWIVVLAACHGSSSRTRTYQLADLPVGNVFGKLPASGTAEVTMDLSDEPREVKDWTKVTGSIDVTCKDCRIGDDHAKIDSRGFGDIPFSHLAWDTATAHVDLADGTAHVVSHSRGDVDIDIDVHATLARLLPDSEIDGCVAFRPSDRLRERDEKLYDLVMLTGAPKGADGRYYLSVRGTAARQRRIPSVCTVAAN